MAKFPFHHRITRFCSLIYRPKIVGPLGGQLHVRTLYDLITRIFFYKKRSKRVTSCDFVFLYNFCTVVSYFFRSSVDSRF